MDRLNFIKEQVNIILNKNLGSSKFTSFLIHQFFKAFHASLKVKSSKQFEIFVDRYFKNDLTVILPEIKIYTFIFKNNKLEIKENLLTEEKKLLETSFKDLINNFCKKMKSTEEKKDVWETFTDTNVLGLNYNSFKFFCFNNWFEENLCFLTYIIYAPSENSNLEELNSRPVKKIIDTYANFFENILNFLVESRKDEKKA